MSDDPPFGDGDDDLDDSNTSPPVSIAPKLKFTSEETTALEKEAGDKGYGKLYAAFGGGKEGLEACAAGAN